MNLVKILNVRVFVRPSCIKSSVLTCAGLLSALVFPGCERTETNKQATGPRIEVLCGTKGGACTVFVQGVDDQVLNDPDVMARVRSQVKDFKGLPLEQFGVKPMPQGVILFKKTMTSPSL